MNNIKRNLLWYETFFEKNIVENRLPKLWFKIKIKKIWNFGIYVSKFFKNTI